MIENAPFWKQKTLAEMTKSEWESLCDGCGLCCMVKLQDEDTNEILITNVACRYLDVKSCQCKDYENRHKNVEDCIQLTPKKVPALDWLPKTCAYRLIEEGKDLYDWHPLISQDKRTVHRAGISKKGMIVSEDCVDNVEDYALACLNQAFQEAESFVKRKGWILCDEGKTGTYRQCLALAEIIEEAYAIPFVHKEISLRNPWQCLPPQFAAYFRKKPESLQKDMFSLKPPYPCVVIAAGRQAIMAAMAFRKHAFIIALQNPRVSSAYFNLVLPPFHDEVKGDNVFSTLGALHPIRPETLLDLRQDLRILEKYQHYPEKRITVLVGGDNKYYRYKGEFIDSMTQRLRYMVTEHPLYKGGSLLLTPSRRTRPELISRLQEGLKGIPCQIWDGKRENPYLEYLALADALVVTGDSISMMSEACLMGKPVYIAEVPMQNTRFKKFRQSLYNNSHARCFFEEFINEGFKPLDELKRIQGIVIERLGSFL